MTLPARRGALSRSILAGLLSACLMGLAPSPAAASPSPETFVTMFSEPGDWVGGGANIFYFPGNGSINVSGNTGYLTVWVSGGNLGKSFSLTFAAAPGEVLQPGEYDRAQRAPFRAAGRPGIDISGDGRGCNTISGRFRVKEITTNADGAITTLWVVYEQHCEGGTPALIGEVRYSISGDGGTVMVNPREIRWPKADPGQSMKVVPVTIVNPGATPTEMGASALSGPDTDEFDIRIDGCAGVTLAANGVCQVLVRYRPADPGDKEATLTIPEAGGAPHTTTLLGYVYPGTTRVALYSDQGDYIGAGQDYSYTPANATIRASGSYEHVGGGVNSSSGDNWSFDFDAPSGDVLVPGTTYNATRYPFNGTGAGMAFTGNGRGCNQIVATFTIADIFVDQYGELQRFGVVFEQHCDGPESSPALHGVIDFRMDPPTDPGVRTVTVTTVGSGKVTSEPAGIDCGTDCAEDYSFGQSVSLSAIPDPGYSLVAWSGACAGSGACTVKATEDRAVEARFAVSTSLSLTASDGRISYGGSVTLTAHLEPVPEGTEVTVYMQPAGGSRTVADSGPVDAAGNFTFGSTPIKNTTFQAEFPGSGDLNSSTSDPVVVNVAVVATATLSRYYGSSGKYKLYHHGDPVPVTGQVVPNHANKQLWFYLYRYRNGAWRLVAAEDFRLSSQSRRTAYVVDPARGKYRTRVRFKDDTDHKGDWSPYRYFKVTD